MWQEFPDLIKTLTPREITFETWKRTITMFLGPLTFLILILISPPEGITILGWRALALVAWVVIWWTGEPFAFPTSALIIFLGFPLWGVLSVADTLGSFGQEVVFMTMGSFIIVYSMTVSGLGKRIALSMLSIPFVKTPMSLFIVFSFTTMMISAVLPNVPTTMMMLSIALPLLTAMGAPVRGGVVTLLLLACAWPSSIGGVITPIGATTPNFFIITVAAKLGVTIPYFQWILCCLPYALVNFVIMCILVVLLYKPKEYSTFAGEEARAVVLRERVKLGPMDRREWNSAIIISLTMVLYMVPGLATLLLGATHPTAVLLCSYLRIDSVAIFGALLCLITPVNWKERKFTLSWKEAGVAADIGMLIYIASGVAMVSAFMKTGLLASTTSALTSAFGEMSPIIVVLLLTAIANLLSQLGLFMVVIASIVPVAGVLVGGIGGSAAAAILAVGMGGASGGAYLLPISTPSNAIPYATGRMSLGDFLIGGSIFSVLTWCTSAFILYPLASLIL